MLSYFCISCYFYVKGNNCSVKELILMKLIVYRGYSNFWNEYAIYFIEWSEKYIFHEWRSHEWNIHFLASRDELNGIFIPKNWIFFLLYTLLSVTDFCTKWRHTRSHITSFKWWLCITFNVGKTETHRSRSRESENFSKSRHNYYQNIPCDLTKKMNTHTLYFCPLIRKLQAFEILKWAQESQWRKQRISNFTREIQLIFSLQWKYSFLYFHGCEIQLF